MEGDGEWSGKSGRGSPQCCHLGWNLGVTRCVTMVTPPLEKSVEVDRK